MIELSATTIFNSFEREQLSRISSNCGTQIFKNREKTFTRMPRGRKVQDFGLKESFFQPLRFSWNYRLLFKVE
jgi:hypothetical protein